jgi:hypothetical protein
MDGRLPSAVSRGPSANGQRQTANDYFAMVRRDELWVRGTLDESRSTQGQATARESEIVARDTIDDRELPRRCEKEMARLRRAIAPIRDARVRGIVTASTTGLESTVTITLGDTSIVTDPDHARKDYELLKSLLAHGTRGLGPGSRNLVWRNGSAAVLLHEAIGHAAEHRHAPLAWPSWLRVRDQTDDGRSADLIAGELPVATRRESFRDVPLRRMTRLVAEQTGAPFEMPDECIEVHLVAGGAYEPLTEIVTINIAVSSVGPFTIRALRRTVAQSLLGATGDPLRYPGVICSREGQELFVGSHAPVMLTTGLQ